MLYDTRDTDTIDAWARALAAAEAARNLAAAADICMAEAGDLMVSACAAALASAVCCRRDVFGAWAGVVASSRTAAKLSTHTLEYFIAVRRDAAPHLDATRQLDAAAARDAAVAACGGLHQAVLAAHAAACVTA